MALLGVVLELIWEGLICLGVLWARGPTSFVDDSESESETVSVSLAFLASSLDMLLEAI